MSLAKVAGGIALFVVATAFFLYQSGDGALRSGSEGEAPVQSTVFVGGTLVRVSVADTPEERTQGLSGRESLASDEGMLFVFEQESFTGFWMKDMRFAIDIIWISSRNEVIDIDKAVAPETYPEVFTPNGPVQFVLEVPAGFSDAHDIQIGSKIESKMVY